MSSVSSTQCTTYAICAPQLHMTRQHIDVHVSMSRYTSACPGTRHHIEVHVTISRYTTAYQYAYHSPKIYYTSVCILHPNCTRQHGEVHVSMARYTSAWRGTLQYAY
jgi:hypothetical protein